MNENEAIRRLYLKYPHHTTKEVIHKKFNTTHHITLVVVEPVNDSDENFEIVFYLKPDFQKNEIKLSRTNRCSEEIFLEKFLDKSQPKTYQ